jgi:hypothetical protein
MYDENSIGTKVGLRQCNILELRVSCAQPKTTRIHDSKLQPNAGVGAIWYSTWTQKLRLSRVEEFGTGSYSGGGEQKSPTPNTRVPKFSQISPATQWHNYACFWYSKIDLDWIGICSKNFICRVMLLWTTAEQRLTKLSITLCRKFLKSWKFTVEAQLDKKQLS